METKEYKIIKELLHLVMMYRNVYTTNEIIDQTQKVNDLIFGSDYLYLSQSVVKEYDNDNTNYDLKLHKYVLEELLSDVIRKGE